MAATLAGCGRRLEGAEVAGTQLNGAARQREQRLPVAALNGAAAARRQPRPSVGEFAAPSAAVRRAIGRRLGERRADIVAAMMREMQRSLPGYERLRGTGHEVDHRAMSTTLLDLFITLLLEDRPISPQEERTLRALASRRGRQGVAVERLRGAVMLAARVGWRYVVECGLELGSEPHTLATVGALGEAIADFCQVALEIMGPAYQSPWSAEVGVADVLAEVLGGTPLDSSPAGMAEVERLSEGLHSPHGLLIVAPVGPPEPGGTRTARCAVDMLLAALPGALDVPVSAGLTGHSTVAVPASLTVWRECRSIVERVAREGNAVILVTVPAVGPVHLRSAYERALELLSVARRICTTPQVIEDADLRLFCLLAACASAHEHFIDAVLGPILALPVRQRDRLLETIAALRDTPLRGGLRAAAKALDVHEKTVAYRIQRIVELTALDPDLPDQRSQLTIAVDLLRLAGWTFAGLAPASRRGSSAAAGDLSAVVKAVI